MSITTLSRKRLAVIATGAVALVTVGLAASAHAGSDDPAPSDSVAASGSTSGPDIHFWTLGEAKAGATIDVFAECGLNKNGIVVTTAEVGGVAKTTLTPMADGPYLIGEVTLPADFAGPSALSLTCDNQATATTMLVAGQTESSADGLIPSEESTGYESEGMGEDTADAASTSETLPFEDGEGYLVPDDCDGGACTGPLAAEATTAG